MGKGLSEGGGEGGIGALPEGQGEGKDLAAGGGEGEDAGAPVEAGGGGEKTAPLEGPEVAGEGRPVEDEGTAEGGEGRGAHELKGDEEGELCPPEVGGTQGGVIKAAGGAAGAPKPGGHAARCGGKAEGVLRIGESRLRLRRNLPRRSLRLQGGDSPEDGLFNDRGFVFGHLSGPSF